MTPLRRTLLALACLSLTAPVFAADPIAAEKAPASETPAGPAKLDVGSPAPALKPAKWIQGDPIENFEGNKTYLIECWATWCGPCVAAIPHVNGLHKSFKDKGLVVIGVNVWEEPESKAAAFVKKKGEGMAYRVAYDGGNNGSVANDWLKAAGANGIPHAFVVRQNKILWHGHPGELTDETVAAMIDGKYDPVKAAAEAAEKEKLGAEFEELQGRFKSLVEAKKADEAEALLRRQVEIAAKLIPAQTDLIRRGGQIELALARGQTAVATAALKDFAQAGEKAAAPGAGWMAATQIITDPRLAGARDYAFALECIDKLIAAEPEAGKSPHVALLRARALSAIGKHPAAIEALKLASAGGEEAPTEARPALDALTAGKPWPKDFVNPDAKPDTDAKPAAPEKK